MMKTMSTKQLLAILGGVVVAAACTNSEGAAPASQDDSTGVRVVNVEVTSLAPTTFTDYLRVTGEAAALHDVTLSAEEMGQVARFLVEKGAHVREGQVIAELDAGVLEAQLAEARAAAELAQEQYERQRSLWEDQHIGSEIAFLQARSQARTAAARVQQLEARVENTKITAPVSGIFDEKYIEAGEMATVGARIARIVSIGRIKVEAGIPERAADAVRPGSEATVSFDVLPGRTFRGRVTFVASSVDRVNRTVSIELELANPDGAIKPSMVANVELIRNRLDSVIVVPQQAVMRTEDGYQALVVVEQDGHPVAAARAVRLGPAWNSQVVVDSGLVAGERLIRLGQQLVDPGTRVRVVNAMPAEEARP